MNLVLKVVGFLKEVRVELKKVVWPEKRYIAVATSIVLVIVFIAGFFTAMVDFIFSKLMFFLMHNFG